jgi:hypothetical protein
VEGGDSAYLQQQNFSLEALAKRDAQPDPFGTSPKPPAPEPTPEPDPVKTISFEAFLMKKSAELAEENAVQSAA